MENYTVAQLRDKAKKMGLTGIWSMKKAELYKKVFKGKKKSKTPVKKTSRKKTPVKKTAKKKTPIKKTKKKSPAAKPKKKTVVKKKAPSKKNYDSDTDSDTESESDFDSEYESEVHNEKAQPNKPEAKWAGVPDLDKIKDIITSKAVIDKQCYDASQYNIEKKELGSGTYGTIHEACSQSDCGHVAKIIKAPITNKATKLFIHEVAMAKMVGDIGLAPKVELVFKCKIKKQPKNVMVIERMKGSIESGPLVKSLTDRDFQELIDLTYKFHLNKFIHLDMGARNILYTTGSKKYYLTDFGMTVYFENEPFPWDLAFHDLLDLFMDIDYLSDKKNAMKYLKSHIPREYQPYAETCLNKIKSCYNEAKQYTKQKLTAKYFPRKQARELGKEALLEWIWNDVDANEKTILQKLK